MRNWRLAFRRASFRGARFWVEEDGPEVGRRVAVHNISGGEAPLTEDLGRRATEFQVQAYVASDLADVEGWALEAACAAPGLGRLTLPLDPSQSAHCLGCRRNRRRDQAGYIAYDLVFVEASSGFGGGVTGLSALRTSFSSGLAAAAMDLSTGM